MYFALKLISLKIYDLTMGNFYNLDSLSTSLNFEQSSMDFTILKSFGAEAILVAASAVFLLSAF